jgi:hypothetical protein
MATSKECMINRQSPVLFAREYYETALRMALDTRNKKTRNRKENGLSATKSESNPVGSYRLWPDPQKSC